MQKQSVFSFKRNFMIMGLALSLLGLASLAASEIFTITDFGVQPDSWGECRLGGEKSH
jgi:hypothetical protein